MPEKKMGKLRASYLLAVDSFEFLRKDPEMLWIPLLSFISTLLSLIIVGGVYVWYVVATDGADSAQHIPGIVDYIFIFLLYLVGAFIVSFFQGAIATMVHMRIDGKDPTLADGIGNSQKHIKKILYYSLLSATVGVVLNLIQERFGWLGRLFSFFGNVAWAVLTFFMVPVIILEDRSIKDSLERSGKIFRDTWGETLVMNFSLSFFFSMILIAWMILCGGLFFFSIGSIIALLVLAVAFFAGLIAIMIMSSILSAIFKIVLYEYSVSGKVPDSFTPELIIGAIKRSTT
jgi:hypothetical protein